MKKLEFDWFENSQLAYLSSDPTILLMLRAGLPAVDVSPDTQKRVARHLWTLVHNGTIDWRLFYREMLRFALEIDLLPNTLFRDRQDLFRIEEGNFLHLLGLFIIYRGFLRVRIV